jgi:hypothetical protein
MFHVRCLFYVLYILYMNYRIFDKLRNTFSKFIILLLISMHSVARILAIFSAASSASSLKLRDLTWELSNCDGSIRVPGSIPGEVHTDLMKANVISSNPYFRYNELNQVNSSMHKILFFVYFLL